MEEQLVRSALDYHRYPTPGKISITPTKGMTNQRDLALAYSPGVAAACLAIAEDSQQARDLTCISRKQPLFGACHAIFGEYGDGFEQT